MKKFIDTIQEKLKNLFTNDYTFHIPRYQREYSWEDEHVETFWNDLISHFNQDDPSEYYFGTIICVDKEDSGEAFTVVDGQQRLTTSMVFLAVVRDLQLELGLGEDALDTHKFLIDDSQKQILSLSKNNADFFNDTILEQIQADKKIKSFSDNVDLRNKQLAEAYTVLNTKISDEISKYSELEEKRKILNSLYSHFLKWFVVVRTTIDSPTRAYKIFETINNRGKGLEESDLVKNYLLSIIDHDELDVNQYYEGWLDLLKKLGVTKTKENEFLWHYMLAYAGPVGPDDVYAQVLEKYKTGDQCVLLIEDLLAKSQIFNKIIKPTREDWWDDQQTVDNLDAFGRLSAKATYPVILKGYDAFGHDKVAFNQFLETLLIFYFRSRTICKTPATKVRGVMNTLCKNLRDNVTISVSDLRKVLLEEHLSEYRDDETFIFNFKKFVANERNAKYILVKINDEMTGTVTIPSPPLKDIQIEHIMPKTFRGTEWEKTLKTRFANEPTKDELNDFHKNNLNKLGNLTFTSSTLNPQLSNKPFKDKVETYRNDNVEITKALTQYHEWNEETIDNRQGMLAGNAKKIWSFEQS